MDTFSVSIANAIAKPDLSARKRCAISGVFAFFQFFMPMAGYICVKLFVTYFNVFSKFIPYIALILLVFVGGKMIREAFSKEKDEEGVTSLGAAVIIVQGIATSIDALSVGFTIADHRPSAALVCCVIIGITTFLISSAGFIIGHRASGRLGDKALILGGVILIAIGIEIFVKGVFF